MSLNGSGIRDIARVLHISPTTQSHHRAPGLKKKAAALHYVNPSVLGCLRPEDQGLPLLQEALMDDNEAVRSFQNKKRCARVTACARVSSSSRLREKAAVSPPAGFPSGFL